MRAEIWRLYRHLVFGSLIVVGCCYVAIEFTDAQFGAARFEQSLCVDAELSAAILLSNPSQQVAESVFSWDIKSKSIPDVDQLAGVLSQKQWLRLSDKSYQLSFGDRKGPLITGVAPHNLQQFHIESLLRHFLASGDLSYKEKIHLFNRMSCISITPVSLKKETLKQGDITFVNSAYNEYGFLWKGETNKAYYILITHEFPVSLTIVVVGIVGIAIIIMLALIWRELFALDLKRKTFESITRQIARGRSGLPKGIPDSSGTLKELAYSFDSMSSHIQRLLKVQREMINAISHELRTPIARLRFGLEVMKDELDETSAGTIAALENDVEELNTLVDEVLTYGKLEEGSLALNFESTSVFQLIEGILQHNQPLLQHLTVEVNIPADSMVIADAHHLHRALQNLILNASKYASSKIAVVFSSDEERWQLDIEDDGPGIAFEDRDKVFIPFQRLDNSRTRASGGYGLGLAIVQRIAFWHGGAVLVDASDLGGAKFSLIWSRNQHQKTVS